MLMPIIPPALFRPYSANAVTFDGATYLSKASALDGISASREFTVSFWARKTTGGVGGVQSVVQFETPGSADRFYVRYTSDGSTGMQIVGVTSTGTNVLTATFDAGSMNAWAHVAISINLSNSGTRHVYVNGSPVSVLWSTYTNGLVDFSQLPTIGAKSGAAQIYKGDLAEVYFDTTYIDLSVSTNLRRFITPGGKTPLRPAGGRIWLTRETDDWHTNKGSGGGFTETGTLTTSSNIPVQI